MADYEAGKKHAEFNAVIQSIEDIMKSHMGLHGSTISDDTVSRAVLRRIEALALATGRERCEINVMAQSDGVDQTMQKVSDYLLLLQHSKREIHQLSELLVVPETWFFRYHKSFDYLRQQAKSWIQHYGCPLPILSLPCATGEEPYSIAMALLDAGINADSFRIDAVDISENALAVAKKAEYGSNSFREGRWDDRGGQDSYRQRHFTQHGHVYHLNANVRATVRFNNYNIMQPDHLGTVLSGESYALVFCRNLLIYFDQPTQEKVISRLRQLLYSDGCLFVGHADTGPVNAFAGGGFSHLHAPSFVYRKGNGNGISKATSLRSDVVSGGRDVANAGLKKAHNIRRKGQPETIIRAKASQRAVATAMQSVMSEKRINKPDLSLATVRQQADAGQLSQALAACQRYLKIFTTDADAWALQGIIYAVQGESEAAQKSLNKAVYLDAQHEEALSHLALLADQQGQAETAKRLRQRLARLSQAGSAMKSPRQSQGS